MAGRLEGRRALVTGAGSGIGKATAERLAADGARVLGADIKGEVDFRLDLRERDASSRLVTDVSQQLGGIDILVLCAGITGHESLDGHSDEFFEDVLAINLFSVFRLIRDAVPWLKQSPHGRIVTIGSTMSRFGDAGMVAYTASKHAVLGLTRAIATELGPFGITANCLQPGAILTPMTEGAFATRPGFRQYWEEKSALGRLGTPQDIADVIAFLVSDDARFVSGQGFLADGGAMQRQ